MKDYLAFCWAHAVTDSTAVGPLLAYLEYLTSKSLNFRTIVNYLSALKQSHMRLGLSTCSFDAPVVSAYIKAISKLKPSVIIKKGVYTVEQLDQLFKLNQLCPDPLPFRLAFALAVFALLRISNLAPPSEKVFDSHKHLTRGDVIITENGALVAIRWAKNLQRTDNTHMVRVPQLSKRPWMCPVGALEQRLAQPPFDPASPLIIRQNRPITERALRFRLALLNKHLNYHDQGLTFHSLRWTGVTLLFGHDVPLNTIRTHGAWASDAVRQYVKNTDKVADKVPNAFVSLFG